MMPENSKTSDKLTIDGITSQANDTQDVEKGISRAEPSPDLEQSDRPELTHVQSRISQHDLHTAMAQSYVEVNASQYTRFSPNRKVLITIVVSICSVLAPVSSTAILSAIPEVAQEYNTTGTIIDLSNALYLVFMGLSPMVYGPLSQVYGRRMVCRANTRKGMNGKLTFSRYASPVRHCSLHFLLARP